MASISKRVSGAWQNTSYGIRATATDTITTLPTTIYGDGTNATVSIKGNKIQNGTPTPEKPIMPEGCGELEAGQYKIPILSAGQTTPVYLGEVETTRKIKKLVLTGEENWYDYKTANINQFHTKGSGIECLNGSSFLSNIAPYGMTPSTRNQYEFGCCGSTAGDEVMFQMYGARDIFTNITAWKSYLAQQYAAGTPVTVWYVLANEETAVVNEPLMRIDDYADEVSGVSIPTTDGANTLSVDTTVQPSEVDVNYHGWHMGTVHERNSGQWD